MLIVEIILKHTYPLASEKIRAMEADVVTVTDARQFNYCDLIADIDGYKIQKLIESSLSIYSLSECLAEYYSNGTMYNKRYQYFKSILGFDEWNVISIKKEILKHFNPVLKNSLHRRQTISLNLQMQLLLF